MFAGAQIVTTKLVQSTNRRNVIERENDEKTSKDYGGVSELIPRSKAAIVVENEHEKIERKVLVQQRKHQRRVEQQKLAEQMEDLMEKVLRETPLSKNDENKLRTKIKTIVNKVNKESKTTEQSDALKPNNQGAFLLWYDKN